MTGLRKSFDYTKIKTTSKCNGQLDQLIIGDTVNLFERRNLCVFGRLCFTAKEKKLLHDLVQKLTMVCHFSLMQTDDKWSNESKQRNRKHISLIILRSTFRSILPSTEPPEYPIGAAYYPLTSMITIKVRHFAFKDF